MIADRYTRAVLAVIAAALVAIAVRPLIPDSLGTGPAHAQMLPPKYEVTVPRAWGKLVAFSNNNLLLEGPDHVLRVVDVEGRAPEYPKVKVQINWQ